MNPNTQTTIQAITYAVPSRTRRGRTHTVSVDPRDLAIVACTCEAGQYGRWCWHRDWVLDGRAGKPRVRVTQRPAAQRLPLSDEARQRAASLEV
jgi:hypothetical protein